MSDSFVNFEAAGSKKIMKNKPLVIVGSGRSGTTWVLDVLAETNNLRPVFEPLNPNGVKEAWKFCNRYVREDSDEPELKSFMGKIFNSELDCLWTKARIISTKMRPSISQITSWKELYTLLALYKKFFIRNHSYARKKSFLPITKFIRANLMFDWLINNFDLRAIFLVRHPGAVVASQIAASKMKGGAVWDYNGPDVQRIFCQYRDDEKLKKDYLHKYYQIFSEKLSPVAGLTMIWCIENILPIYNLQKKNRYVFFYEDIVMQPDREFRHMVKILGLHRNPDNSIIVKPSQQAPEKMMNQSFEENQLTRWMKSFNQEQLSEIDRILKFFNVTTYSAYEPMPMSRTQGVL